MVTVKPVTWELQVTWRLLLLPCRLALRGRVQVGPWLPKSKRAAILAPIGVVVLTSQAEEITSRAWICPVIAAWALSARKNKVPTVINAWLPDFICRS